MAYTVHQAKTHFSRLLREAEAGQEVIVMRGNKPVARVVPIVPVEGLGRRTVGGRFRGQVSWTEGAFAPMTDEELLESGLGYMVDAPLVAPEPKAGR